MNGSVCNNGCLMCCMSKELITIGYFTNIKHHRMHKGMRPAVDHHRRP